MLLVECLACGSRDLQPILDLGEQVPANAFHAADRDPAPAPLGVVRCARCTHAQLIETVNPGRLFSHYAYQTGVSGLTDSQADFIRYLEQTHGKGASILEPGCNDGTLLRGLVDAGFDALGVDPARNLCAAIEADGYPVVCAPWNNGTAMDLDGRMFDAVVAFNVLAHVENPIGFLSACRRVLKPSGCLYVQTSQVRWLERGEFDCVYHEHVSYFTPKSLTALAKRAGLRVLGVEEVQEHGSSFRYRIGHRDGEPSTVPPVPAATGRWIQRDADEMASTLRAYVNKARAEGPVVGIGACAKGMTVLQYADTPLDYLVDETPTKVGRLSPGLNIPVVDFAHLAADPAERLTAIILAWNHYDTLAKKVKQARAGQWTIYARCFPRYLNANAGLPTWGGGF